jgi:hypothetical protein
MSDDQEIVQSRFGYMNRFRFGEDQLTLTLRDRSGESTRSINYEAINPDSSSTLKINAGKRYSFLIALIGTALTMAIQVLCPGRVDFAMAAATVAIAAYFVLVYRNVMTLTFTLLPPADAAGAAIRITHDKRYDDILQRIKSGRIARLRKLHLAVNFDNAPKQEARKFKRLLDEGAISEAEYELAISQLKADASSLSDGARPAVHLQ